MLNYGEKIGILQYQFLEKVASDQLYIYVYYFFWGKNWVERNHWVDEEGETKGKEVSPT